MPYNPKSEMQRYRKYYQSIEPILQKPANRAYTSVVFSFLAVSLFGWYAIRPTIQTILSLQREIKDKTLLDKQMEDKITALIEAQAAYENVQPLLPLVDQALPATPDVLRLARQIRNLSEATNVSLSALQIPAISLASEGGESTLSAQPPAPAAKAKAATTKQPDVVLNVTVEGPFPAVKSFLDGLLSMRRVVTIEGLVFTPQRQSQIAVATATQTPESTESAAIATPAPTINTVQVAIKLRGYYLAK